MKKLFLFTLIILYGANFTFAQLTLSSGTTVNIASGSHLIVNDVNNTSGTINNAGTLHIKGDVTNNSGGLFDSGSTGTVTFAGTSAQEITGAASVHFYGSLNINNANGVSITSTTTGANQEMHGTLGFTSGKLTLNEFDLSLAGTADPTGVDADAYIVTNGTGQLKRTVGSNNVLFPVGNSVYNPITLNNTGTSDIYGVKAVETEPTNFSGTTHIVNESWDVTEAVADGSNLTVTTQWNSGDEATPFDRTKSCVGFTTNAGTDVIWGAVADAGSAPFTRSTTGITSVGTFMVADDYYGEMRLDLKVVLAAAWNDANDNMDNNLNTGSPNLIPLTDPYSVGVTVTNIPATAVDWVKVELRNSSDRSTVTNTYAKFVDVNGQVIEEDGTNMKVTGVSGTYYVAVNHRNHLGVVTNAVVDLTGAPAVDFTSLTVAWVDQVILNNNNDAMDEVEAGTSVYGLWAGDANNDGEIKVSGGSDDKQAILNLLGVNTPGTDKNGYYTEDVNMDGVVKVSGSNDDKQAILNSLGTNTPGSVYLEHIPQ